MSGSSSFPSSTSTSPSSPSPSPVPLSFGHQVDSLLSSDEWLSVGVASMSILLSVVEQCCSQQNFMSTSEFVAHLKNAKTDILTTSTHRSSIALSAACQLFIGYVTRTPSDQFEPNLIRQRAKYFYHLTLNARKSISVLSNKFISDGAVILIHGFSRVVLNILLWSAKKGNHFSVLITEGRPQLEGVKMASFLISEGIPTTVILDSSVASVMDTVDFVLVGAESVSESGGIINKIGTLNVAIIAHQMSRPFYVAAECCKFARIFPLNQRDIKEHFDDHHNHDGECHVEPEGKVETGKETQNTKTDNININKMDSKNPNDDENNKDKDNDKDKGSGSGSGSKSSKKKQKQKDKVKEKENENDMEQKKESSPSHSPSSPSSPSLSLNISHHSHSPKEMENFILNRAKHLHHGEHPNHSSLGSLSVLHPNCDYTHPQFITLMFTDLGVLTPSAISDELIKLYQ